jgi:hypothetical protein
VEVANVTRSDILENRRWRGDRSIHDPPTWNYNYARNPLLFAMDSENVEVAEYLLQEWNNCPVSVNVERRGI